MNVTLLLLLWSCVCWCLVVSVLQFVVSKSTFSLIDIGYWFWDWNEFGFLCASIHRRYFVTISFFCHFLLITLWLLCVELSLWLSGVEQILCTVRSYLFSLKCVVPNFLIKLVSVTRDMFVLPSSLLTIWQHIAFVL